MGLPQSITSFFHTKGLSHFRHWASGLRSRPEEVFSPGRRRADRTGSGIFVQESRQPAFTIPAGRLKEFTGFARHSLREISDRVEGNGLTIRDEHSGRFSQVLQALGFDAGSSRRMRQLGELLVRLDRRSHAGLLSTLEKFVERYPSLAGETGSRPGRLGLEHFSLRVSVCETPVGVSGEGVPVRRLEFNFDELQARFRWEEQSPGAGSRPDGLFVSVLGSGRPAQTVFLQGSQLVAADGNESGEDRQAEGTGGDVSVSVNVKPQLWSDATEENRFAAFEVSAEDELRLGSVLSGFEPDEKRESGGLYRVSNSVFRRGDSSEGMLFDYFFGYRPVR